MKISILMSKLDIEEIYKQLDIISIHGLSRDNTINFR